MARVKCPYCFHVNPDQQEKCQKCDTPLPRIRIEARSVINDAQAPLAPNGPQFKRGQVVGGRYTVLNLIGQGGMGSIYKVHDNTLGEDVALKTLLPQFIDDKVVLERFYNEAKIARRLAHQNIVRVHDIGEDGKVLYISMEYLQGMSLREVIDNLKPGERLPIAQTLRIFDELCAALEYAHQFTVHRDIKPENVMLGQDGRVRLMDFGISKLMANTRLTGASVVMGTPFYMSPEQIKNSRDVDARADIYSVGVMLYEILTGSVPTGVPKPASQIMKDVPPAMDKIVMKCVDPNPANRYQNASELRHAFIPIRELVKSGVSVPKREAFGGVDRSESYKKIGGVLAMVAVVAAAIWGVTQAEARRGALLEAIPDEAATAPAPGTPVAPTFAEYEALVDELVPRARLNQNRPGVPTAIEDGDAFWEQAVDASEAGEPDKALELAGYAFQCYLAPLMATEGMVFVKPGSIQLPGRAGEFVGGFFIDRDEVTFGEYREFVRRVPAFSPLPADYANLGSDYNDYPIADITCIDAMAYAAARGCMLPSEAEWSRAAYGGRSEDESWPDEDGWSDDEQRLYNFGDGEYGELAPVGSFPSDQTKFTARDMIGNVAEWTRSSEGGSTGYGALMTVCGVSFRQSYAPPQSREARHSVPMEAHFPNIGFRCVKPVPSSPAAVRYWLDQ